MTDPISGKAASQMAEQASEIGGEEAGPERAGSSAKASFDDVLSDVENSRAEEAERVDEVDQLDRAEQVDAASEVEGPAEERLREFVDGVQGDETRIDEMMNRSLSGADMSQQDMLQMQALIYSYSQKVELATKAVSSVTDGMKQVMNTQV